MPPAYIEEIVQQAEECGGEEREDGREVQCELCQERLLAIVTGPVRIRLTSW